jgi:hypothetical protein
VTSAPSSVSVASRARAAVISFSPGATARWPRLSRASAPKAATTCRGERPAARSKDRRSVRRTYAAPPGPRFRFTAVDGQHIRAIRAEVREEGLEGPPERRRIEQPEHSAERVVVPQATLEA